MGYLEGILSGFTARKGEVEAENRRQAELTAAREGKIFEALLASSDPETRSMAIAGLLASAQPGQRKGGFRGWLGEMEQNPWLPRVQALVQTPVTETQEIRGPQEMQGYIPQPPGPQPAALPATNAIEPGMPGPTPAQPLPRPDIPVVPIQPDVRVGQAPGPIIGQKTVTRPRQVLPSPEEALLSQRRAMAQGDVEGEVAGLVATGFSEEEARELVRQDRLRRATAAAPFQSVAGQLPDGTLAFGTFDRATGRYIDPDTGQPLAGFQPRVTSASASLGIYAERAAGELGYPNAAAARAAGPEAMRRVNERAQQLAAEQGGATVQARGQAAADVPLTTQQRFQATTRMQDDWREIEAPHREMQRQYQLMTTGLRRYKEGDRIGGSQAVLVTFQKILDPDSVVRESEYARSPAGLPLRSRLEGMYDRYIGQWDPVQQRWVGGGAGVPEHELAEMVETANQFLQNMEGWNAQRRAIIARTATDYGIDPSLIFGGPSAQVGTPPPGGATAPLTRRTTAPAAPGVTLDSPLPPGTTVNAQGEIILP